MNKNYIGIIRKSFHSPKEDKPMATRKIIFPTCDFESESIFDDECRENDLKNEAKVNHIKKKTKKIKTLHKKIKHNESTNLSDNEFDWRSEIKHPNDEVQNFLSPSTSEFDIRNSYDKESDKGHDTEFLHDLNNETNDSEENEEFELDEFSDSREHIMNESLTEAHSGIEEIFNLPLINEIKISSKRIVKKPKKKIEILSTGNSDITESGSERKKHVKTMKSKNNSLINHLSSNITSLELDDENLMHINGNSNECQTSKEPDFAATKINDVDIDSVHLTKNLHIGDAEPPDINSKCFDLDNLKVVILKDQRSLPIYGNFLIKVLKGQVEIFGSVIDKLNEMTKIYSPRGYSLLLLKNVTVNENECYLNELYQFPKNKEEFGNTVVERNSAVFVCFKLQDERLKFIQRYFSHQIFPKVYTEEAPVVTFEPKDNMNVISEDQSWQNIVEIVQPTTKLFIAGGKGVGKSTFLRYVINKLLNKFNRIMVIDLDPGQSEFNMPGTLSVFTISEPVIGPNFTHIKNPVRSYLTDISVADPHAYLKNVTSLAEYVANLDKSPTLINYMGYSKGLGIKIISTVITLLKPTNVVQIDSNTKNKNFPCDLNLANIRRNLDYFGGNVTGISYKLHKITSLTDANTGWKLEPRQARELCILAYLGEGMINSINSLTDHNLPMYELKLSSIKIRDLKNRDISPAAINANLIALCSMDDVHQNFICLGFGVVRGIDLENDYLVLITQVNPEVLNEVTYMVLSSASLPASIYMTTQNIRGLIPYVKEGELSSLAQLTRRSYLPAAHNVSK